MYLEMNSVDASGEPVVARGEPVIPSGELAGSGGELVISESFPVILNVCGPMT